MNPENNPPAENLNAKTGTPIQGSPRKQSSLGIISLCIGVFGFALLFTYMVSSFVGLPASAVQSFEKVILCLPPFLVITGLVLSIVGLLRRKDKKLFPILGLVINVLYLITQILVTLLLFVSG
jgi:hypothetical protein